MRVAPPAMVRVDPTSDIARLQSDRVHFTPTTLLTNLGQHRLTPTYRPKLT
jgi:hypothetical protein